MPVDRVVTQINVCHQRTIWQKAGCCNRKFAGAGSSTRSTGLVWPKNYQARLVNDCESLHTMSFLSPNGSFYSAFSIESSQLATA
jgi:hypothetical protein